MQTETSCSISLSLELMGVPPRRPAFTSSLDLPAGPSRPIRYLFSDHLKSDLLSMVWTSRLALVTIINSPAHRQKVAATISDLTSEFLILISPRFGAKTYAKVVFVEKKVLCGLRVAVADQTQIIPCWRAKFQTRCLQSSAILHRSQISEVVATCLMILFLGLILNPEPDPDPVCSWCWGLGLSDSSPERVHPTGMNRSLCRTDVALHIPVLFGIDDIFTLGWMRW